MTAIERNVIEAWAMPVPAVNARDPLPALRAWAISVDEPEIATCSVPSPDICRFELFGADIAMDAW